MAKIKRKFMAHYIDTSETATPAYELLGADLEEYSAEMNANVDTKTNILGETSTTIDSYEVSADIDPFIADSSSAMFTRLQGIIDERQTLDDLKTTVIEVHLWETATAGAYPAYRENAIIEVTSYGGDTTAYQIPFTIHYTGSRVAGTFDPTTKTFTAS